MLSTNTPRTKIINGDCIDVLQRVPDSSIDLVVTDPPYLVNYSSRDGRKIANDISSSWLKPAFAQTARVLKQDRFCISFYGWNQADRFLQAWKAAGFYPVGHLVWAKSYASSRRGFLRATHECAYLLAKGRPARPRVLLNDVQPWSYSGNKLHPTQKPLSAIEPLIAAFSEPGDVILDPFAGSGTTGVAAKLSNSTKSTTASRLSDWHSPDGIWPCFALVRCGAFLHARVWLLSPRSSAGLAVLRL